MLFARRPLRGVIPSLAFPLRFDQLEDRTAPAVLAENVFALFKGTLATATDASQIGFTLRSEDLTLPDGGSTVLLGFRVSPAADSGLDPRAVEIRDASGSLVPTALAAADLPGSTDSVVLAALGFGDYSVSVGSERGTAGGFRLDVYLVGDANGSRGVGRAKGGGDWAAIQHILGVGAGSPSYRASADGNLDGVVDAVDKALWRQNRGAAVRSEPLTLAAGLRPTPTTLADGSLLAQVAQGRVIGTTAPGAAVTLDADGDGQFDDGAATADATGKYTIPVTLVEGARTLVVRASGSLGQARTAALSVRLDTTPPTASLPTPNPGTSATTLTVNFGDVMGPSAADASNYTLTRSNGTPIAIRSVERSADKTSVQLTLAAPLAGGDYVLAVGRDVLDRAGNALARPRKLGLTVSDLGKPSVTAHLDSETATGTNAGGLTSDPLVAGTVNATGAVTSFRAGLDAAPVGSFADVLADLRSDGTFSLSRARLEAINGGPLSDGPHTLHLRAAVGGGPAGTRDLAFTLDTRGPTVTLASPPNGPAGGSSVHATGSVADATSSVAHLRAQVDGGSFFDVAFDPASGGFDVDITPRLTTAPDGSHTLRLEATDAAGNTSATVRTFSTSTSGGGGGGGGSVGPPPAAPAFDLSPVSDTDTPGDQRTTAARVVLLGQTSPNARVTLTPTGAVALADSTGAFRFPDVALAVGSNAFTARATNPGSAASSFSLTIERVAAPAASDVVLDWVRVALDAVRVNGSTPPAASRSLAMASAAVYDAVSAIDGTPGVYVRMSAPAGASVVAAASSAAHRVLSYLFPAQSATLDAALASSLAAVPNGAGKDDGVALGRAVGDAVIDLRSGDGWDKDVDYTPQSAPGVWQATAPMYAPALLPQWGDLEPFVVTNADQFLPPGPPALTSQQWADALNEVKSLGRATNSTRTPDQTQIARFWADGGGTVTPVGHWDQIALQVAQGRGDSVAANARLFAELNLAMGDAGIVVWKAKYADGLWRPITAIRAADTDGNAATTSDATWTPLLPTPNFPEYISGHSTFSGTAEAVLTSFFGDNVSFTIGSPSLPNVQRSFTSFHAAAEEAGRSRIYGGIHYQFSNKDGLAAGRAIGASVVDAFRVSADTRAPNVAVAAPESGRVAAGNVTVTGRAIDNLTGVKSLEVQVDDGTYTAVALDALGVFGVPTAFPTDGTADGPHTLRFRATDFAGNVSNPVEFTLTLDTLDPSLDVTAPEDGGGLSAGDRLTGTLSGTGSAVTAFSYHFDGGVSRPLTPSAGFSVPLDLSRLGAGPHTLTVTATDAAGHTATRELSVTLPEAIPLTVTEVTPADGADEVGVTFRPKVRFSRPIDVTSLTADNFYLTDTAGTRLAATITPSNDGSFAWLFPTDPMPGSSTITLTVDGSTIRAADGALLDATGTGTPGSVLRTDFTTVSTTALPATSIGGVLLDPGPDLKPMTFDDVRAGPDAVLITPDDVYLNPIAGAKIFILGMEDEAVYTDAQGRFNLASVPSGDVKLVIQGRTATNAPAGTYYPEMVMDLVIEAGRVNTVMGTMGTREQRAAMDKIPAVYLPRLQSSILQDVSATEPTTITVPAEAAPDLTARQRELLTAEVQPGTAIGPDGQVMDDAQVGISTVPPELIRDMLPPGVAEPTFTITVQAPGVTSFSTPLKMTYPNVDDVAPGTKMLFISFDHATGRLEIDGTATVSPDGETVVTDPDSGITHPGWHFISFGSVAQGSSPDGTAARADAEHFQDFLVGPGQPPIFVTITTDPEDAQVSWTITPNGTYSGTVANNHGTTKEFSFTPDVTGVRPNYQGNGSFQENPGISYTITYTVTSPGADTFNGTATITQNRKARLRQEYVDYGLDGTNVNGVRVPTIDEVVDAQDVYSGGVRIFTAAEFSQGSNYSPLIVDSGMTTVAKSIRDAYAGPVTLSSGFRNPQHNRAIPGPGALYSVHQSGGAVDLHPIQSQNTVPNRVRLYRAAISVNPGFVYLEAGATPLLPFNWNPPQANHTFSVPVTGGTASVAVVDTDNDDLPDSVSQLINAPQAGIPSKTNLQYAGGGSTNPPFRVVDENGNGRIDVGESLQLVYGGQQDLASYFEDSDHTHADNVVRPGNSGNSAQDGGDSDPPVSAASSTAPGFGSDPRLYYRFKFSNGVELAEQTDAGGTLSAVVAPNTDYTLNLYQATTNRSAVYHGSSNASGAITDVGPFILDKFGGPDSDGDGIPDVGETAIGTNPNKTDTDGDGFSDSAELAKGLDPLTSRPSRTGVIAALPLQGNAEKIAVDGDRVYVATGTGGGDFAAASTSGIAVIDGTQFGQPVLLSQLDLPGNATGIGIDGSLKIAAVATGSALQLVDVSDGTAPRLVRSVNVPATLVEVVNGLAYAVSDTTLSVVDVSSGAVIQTLGLPGTGSVTGFAREGAKLYAFVSGSDTFSVIDITTVGAAAVRGQLHVDVASGDVGLQVGNGIAWLAGSGLHTIDVSDPTDPTLVHLPSGTELFNARRIALNGTGLGLLLPDFGNFMQVYDTTNPNRTANLLLQTPLSGGGRDVAISRGYAYVAEGDRVEVVNYLPFDNRGVPPTATLSTSAADVDPASPGLQVLEGTNLPLRVSVSDDVQVAKVELLLDGKVIRDDVSFPFDFFAFAPAVTPPATTFTLQVRATDTGGNSTLSAPLVVAPVADTYPPQLLSVSPRDGGLRGRSWRTATFTFSERLDPATVNAQNFRLIGPGGEVTPTGVELVGQDTVVRVTYPAVAFGTYQLVIDAAGVKDRAGNAMGAGDVTSSFQVQEFSAVWTNPDGGNWDDPTNWSDGVVPGPDDDVLIDVPGDAEITFATGSYQVNRLYTRNAFRMTGGRLTADTIETDNTFNLDGGTVAAAAMSAGPGGSYHASGFGALDGVTLNADLAVEQFGNLTVRNGLVLNGTLTVDSDGYYYSYGALRLEGTQTLSGTGQIVLGGATTSPYLYLYDPSFGGSGATVTLGSGLTLRGTGQVYGFYGNERLVNQGHIRAEGDGKTLLVGVALSNAGSLEAGDGATLDLAGKVVLGEVSGAVVGAGAAVRVSGTIDNDGRVLQLDQLPPNLTFQRFTVLGGEVTAAGAFALPDGWDLTLDGTQATVPLTVGDGETLTLDGNWTASGLSVTGGTLNLGGAFTLAQLGAVARSGGSVTLTGTLDNTGTTLALDATTGSWNLYGGTIKGGTVTATDGASLLVGHQGGSESSYGYGTLDGVTLNSDVSVASNSSLTVSNGLTLNGTLSLGTQNNSYGYLYLTGAQALSGTGQIVLGGANSYGYVYLYDPTFGGAATVTLGPDLTLRGSGQVYGPSGANRLVNQGLIRAEGAGRTLLVATDLTNTGRLEAGDGSTLDLAGTVVLSEVSGAVVGAGGVARVSGIIDNAGRVLQLDQLPPNLTFQRFRVAGGEATASAGGPFALPDGWDLTLGGVRVTAPLSVGSGEALTLDGTWTNAGGLTVAGGTLNLGGSFATDRLGSVTRSGGSVNLTGALDNTGRTLSLDATTGSWNLSGGTIRGGTVAATGGASLLVGGVTSGYGTLDGVTLNSDVSVGGSTLIVRNGLVLNGTLSVGTQNNSYGSLDLEGTQLLSGTGQVVLGGANSSSSVYLYSTTFGTPATVTLGSGLTLRGSGQISSGSPADRLANQGRIRAEGAGKSLTIYSGLSNAGSLEAGEGSTLDLAGTVVLSEVSGAVVGAGAAAKVSGTIDNTGRTLALDQLPPNLTFQRFTVLGGEVNAAGAFALPDGWNLTLDGARVTAPLAVGDGEALILAGNWTNAGGLAVTGGTLNLGGTFTLAQLGAVARSGGSVNLTGTLDNTGTTLALDATTGSWNLYGGTIRGGTVTATGGASLAATQGGYLSGVLDGVTLNADVTVGQGSSLTVRNGLTLNGTLSLGTAANFYGYLYLEGTQALSGTGQIVLGGTNNVGYVYLYDPTFGGVATVTLGPSLTLRGSGQVFGSSGTERLVNRGTVRAEGAGRSLAFTISGLINQGTLEARDGSTLSAVNLQARSGTVRATAGSSIDVNGSLTVSPEATVGAEVAGADPGDVGKVAVTGTANLAGTLDAAFVNGFAPAVGDSFTLLTFARRVGAFDGIVVHDQPPGVTISPQYGATDLTLAAG